MKTSTTKDKIYIVISIFSLIAIWKIASLIINKDIILPSPEATLKEIITIIRTKVFYIAIYNTVKRATIGFVISFGAAVITGIIAGLVKPVFYLLKPIVLLQKSVPTMAVAIWVLMWLDAEKAPIVVAALIIFPIIYNNVVHGIKSVDPKLIEMAHIYKLDKKTIIKDIYIPSIKSFLLSATSISVGLNLKIIIAAEVLSQANISIGTMFQQEKASLNTAGVLAWAFIAVVIAAVFDYVFYIIQERYSLKRTRLNKKIASEV